MGDLRRRPSKAAIVPLGHRPGWQAVRDALASFGTYLADAIVWFLLLLAAGAAMLVAGVYLIVGIGWALIAGGLLCICAASFIRKGMTDG